MTTLLIDVLIVVWLLLFGGMALLPVLTSTSGSRHQSDHQVEDRVISIAPARPANRPQGQRTPLIPRGGQHDRPAA